MDIGLIILVVSVLLVSYGGMHYYFYRKLRWIFPGQKKIITVFLITLASLVFVVEAMTHTGFTGFVTPLAWVSSLWTGYVFIFFTFAGTLDITMRLVFSLDKENTLPKITQRTKSIILSAIAFLVSIWGFFSAQQTNILSYTLDATKLHQPITIVQITDLHMGLLSSKGRIQTLVNDINALNADIIVSTGDLVDMQLDYLDGFSAILAALNAKLGKYAVYGNHEAIAGVEKARAFTERAGFVLLSNRGITLDQRINLVGVDDPAVHGRFLTSSEQEKKLLEEFSSKLFTVFLKHQPVVAPETRGMFDLQLSGHTHGGQIFPFSLLTKLFYSVPSGLSKIGAESWLYVSKGTGTWGPPMRVLARPEVSVFYLEPNAP